MEAVADKAADWIKDKIRKNGVRVTGDIIRALRKNNKQLVAALKQLTGQHSMLFTTAQRDRHIVSMCQNMLQMCIDRDADARTTRDMKRVAERIEELMGEAPDG